MVARTAVPIQHRNACVRTELHHAKGGGCAGVGVPVPACADEGVNVIKLAVGGWQ